MTFGDIEVQSDPVTFDNSKPLAVVGGRKAEVSIKGQGLLHISDKSEEQPNRGGGDPIGMMPSVVFLSSMNHLLVLGDNGEHPVGETKFRDHPRQERIVNPAIGEQLFIIW